VVGSESESAQVGIMQIRRIQVVVVQQGVIRVNGKKLEHLHHFIVVPYTQTQLPPKRKALMIVFRGCIMATSTNWKQNGVLILIMLFVKRSCRVKTVRQTPSRSQTAGLGPAVSARPARLGVMGARARRVRQASTRQAQEAPHARIVAQGNTLRPSVQHQTHVATVRRIHTHLRAAGPRPTVNATQVVLVRMVAIV